MYYENVLVFFQTVTQQKCRKSSNYFALQFNLFKGKKYIHVEAFTELVLCVVYILKAETIVGETGNI